MANSSNTIGIVVAAYNAEKTISSTIESIKNQTSNDYRCVIVNDGSVDNTLEIAISAIAEDERFLVIDQENCGAANARNKAVSELKSQYFFYVDADDEIDKDFIKIMSNYIGRYPGYEAYSANALFVDLDKCEKFYEIAQPTKVEFKSLCEKCCIIGGGTIINRETFLKLDGFDERRYAEDYDFWLRFYANGCETIAFPDVLYRYNLPSVVDRKSDNWKAGIISAIESLEGLLSNENLSSEEIEYVNHAVKANRLSLDAASIHAVMNNQRKEIYVLLEKIFGKNVAGWIMKVLSLFGPLFRKLRVWYAVRKTKKI